MKTVEKLGSEEDGCVNVKIVCKENVDIREALYFTLAKAGLPIMKLNYVEKSLEDIFLELTEAGFALKMNEEETTQESTEHSVEATEIQKEEQ